MFARNASCSHNFSRTSWSSATLPIPWLGPAMGPTGCPAVSEHSPQPGTWNPISYHPASEDTNAWPPGHSVSTSTTEAWVSEPGGQSSYWSGTPGDQLCHQHPHRTRPCTVQCPPWTTPWIWRWVVGPRTCPSASRVYGCSPRWSPCVWPAEAPAYWSQGPGRQEPGIGKWGMLSLIAPACRRPLPCSGRCP